MVFEVEYLKVTASLDPTKGRRYVEPKKRKELDNIYNMILQMYYYVNHIVEDILKWRSINSYARQTQKKPWMISNKH
jgi:hypothetical protein